MGGGMLSAAAGWPVRAAPVHIVTIFSKVFHSPLSRKSLFDSQDNITIPSTEKHSIAHGVCTPGPRDPVGTQAPVATT